MKALSSSSQPIVYTLEGAQLVNSLPYVDQHLMKHTEDGSKVSKSLVKKIRKMIAHETSLLDKEAQPKNYLDNLPCPSTPHLD
jgi:hypothetical protein